MPSNTVSTVQIQVKNLGRVTSVFALDNFQIFLFRGVLLCARILATCDEIAHQSFAVRRLKVVIILEARASTSKMSQKRVVERWMIVFALGNGSSFIFNF